MSFKSLTVFSLAASAIAGPSTITPRNFNPETDHDLGIVGSFDAFYELLNSNSSEWEVEESFRVATPEEISLLSKPEQAVDYSPTTEVSSLTTASFCDSATGWTEWVCDRIPNQYQWWALGGGLLIYYHASILNGFMWRLARFQADGGFSNRYRIRRSRGGNTEEVVRMRTLDEWDDAKVIHFKIENMSEEGLDKRFVDTWGVGTETHLYTEYSYDPSVEEIYYERDSTTLTVDGPGVAEPSDDGSVNKRQSDNWSALVTIVRRSNIIPPGNMVDCIADVFKKYFDRTSETNRFSCQPIEYNGWFAAVGVFINNDQTFWQPNECC